MVCITFATLIALAIGAQYTHIPFFAFFFLRLRRFTLNKWTARDIHVGKLWAGVQSSKKWKTHLVPLFYLSAHTIVVAASETCVSSPSSAELSMCEQAVQCARCTLYTPMLQAGDKQYASRQFMFLFYLWIFLRSVSFSIQEYFKWNINQRMNGIRQMWCRKHIRLIASLVRSTHGFSAIAITRMRQ